MKGCLGNTIESHKSLKKRQNAPFSFIAFKICSASQNIASKRVTLHALGSLFSYFFLRFQIVSNTARMHALLFQ